MRYDPAVGPDPTEWLELDEGERVVVVRQYHKRARARAGSPELHAIIHVTVETQLAEGHPDVKAAFERLSREGLDRHSVVHAIGSVLAGEIYGVMKSQRPHDPREYARKLKELTAEACAGPKNDHGSLPIQPSNDEMKKLEHQQLPAFASVSLGAFMLLLSGPGASGSRPIPGGKPQEPGGGNRVVRVTDLPAQIEALKKVGVSFRNQMEVGPGGRQVQVEDPDGNPIELFEPAR